MNQFRTLARVFISIYHLIFFYLNYVTLSPYCLSIPLKLNMLHLSNKTEAVRDFLFLAGVAEVKVLLSVGAADRAINHVSTNGSSK